MGNTNPVVAGAGNTNANLACTVAYSRQFNYAGAFPGLNPLPPAAVAWAPVEGNGAGSRSVG